MRKKRCAWKCDVLFQALVSEIAVKCLSTKDLISQCCLELVQQQPEITESSPIGELSFSIGYFEQKSSLEVNILNAKLVNGDKHKKDGMSLSGCTMLRLHVCVLFVCCMCVSLICRFC